MVAVRSGGDEVGRLGGPGGAAEPGPLGGATRPGAGSGPAPAVGPWLAIVVVVASMLGGSAAGGGRAGNEGAAASVASLEPETTDVGVAASSGRAALHVVQPGETYWSIAVALGGDDDGEVRSLVAALEAANGDRPLQAGDRLLLPGAGG